MKKTFNQWNKGDLQREFGLKRHEECEDLKVWLSMAYDRNGSGP